MSKRKEEPPTTVPCPCGGRVSVVRLKGRARYIVGCLDCGRTSQPRSRDIQAIEEWNDMIQRGRHSYYTLLEGEDKCTPTT